MAHRNVILHIFATLTTNTLWMDCLCTFAKSSSFSFCSSLVFFSPLTSSLPQFGDCSGLRVPKFVLGHLQSLSGVQIRLWDRSVIILVSANFAEWQAATCWWSSFWLCRNPPHRDTTTFFGNSFPVWCQMQCLKTRKNRLVWEVTTLHPKLWLGQKKGVFYSMTVICIWLWSSVISMSYWLYFFHYFSCLKNCNKISRTLQRRSLQWTLTSHNRSWIWVKRTRASLLKTLTSSSTVLPLSALVSHSSELFFSSF